MNQEKLVFHDLQPLHDKSIMTMETNIKEYTRPVPMAIGGITLSKALDVKNLSEEQVETLKTKHSEYLKEKLALEGVLSSFEMKHIVFHKSFFASLTQALGLIRKYEAKNEPDDFVIGHRPEKLLALNLRQKKLRETLDGLKGFIVVECIVLIITELVVFFNCSLSTFWYTSFFATIALGFPVWQLIKLRKELFAVQKDIRNYVSDRIDTNEKKRELVKEFFPKLTPERFEGRKWINENKEDILKWQTFDPSLVDANILRKIYVDSIIRHGKSEKYIPVEITLPDPPDYARKAMEKFMLHFPEHMLKKGRLCVIADPTAVGIKVITSELEFPPLPTEPGIAFEYGSCIVVLPETFYHVTEFEEEFLRRAQTAAETWNPVEAMIQE